MPSAVCIASGYNSTVNESNITYENFQSMSDRGAGVIIEIDKAEGEALIVTCEHVVSGNQDSIYIILSDSYKPVKAQYLGGIRDKDIALLKISNSAEIRNSSAQAAEIANSSYISYGNNTNTNLKKYQLLYIGILTILLCPHFPILLTPNK